MRGVRERIVAVSKESIAVVFVDIVDFGCVVIGSYFCFAVCLFVCYCLRQVNGDGSGRQAEGKVGWTINWARDQ